MAPHGMLEVVESFGRQEKTIGRKIVLPFWSYFFHQPKTYPAAYTHRTKARPSRKQACCVPDFVALISPFLSCARLLLFPWTLILSFLAASFLALIVGQPSPRRILLLHELQRSRLLGTSLLLDGSSCCMNCSVPETPSLPLGQSSPSTVPPPLLRVA